MDEGSIADDDKFEAYFERFKNIFDSANSAYVGSICLKVTVFFVSIIYFFSIADHIYSRRQ